MLEVFGITDAGCVRANNEDCYVIAEDIGLFLVADGMGGAQAGEYASRMAARSVTEQLRAAGERDRDLLVTAIRQANEAVMRAAAGDLHLEGMGTTIVAMLHHGGGRTWIANVGDSRAYLANGHGLREITEDQTWVNEVGRKLGIGEDALRVHPMRHVLTMAVGVSNPLRVNTYGLQLTPGAQVLLCSDGLHGVISDQAIGELLADSRQDLQQKCKALIDAAREAGGPDNVTVVLLRFV
jgi:protein phosphatase